MCFSHPDAVLDDKTRDLERHEQMRQRRQDWEEFTFITPAAFTAWVAALKFGVDRGHTRRFEPYRLTPAQLVELAEQALGGTLWTEIRMVMPTGLPYAYLTVIEQGAPVLSFNLINEQHTLGRDVKQCDLIIPEQFDRTSRKHGRIIRELNDVYIEDLGSSKGTFVEGQPITGRRRLAAGEQITLGGPALEDKVCLLEYSLTPRVAARTYVSDI